MYAGCVDRSAYLLAAGTDRRLRFWDLDSLPESYVAVHAPDDPFTSIAPSYRTRLIDGTCVIYEAVEVGHSVRGRSDEVPRAGPEPAPAGHRDGISEVTLCKASQCFLVTGARDGVVKVWK